MKSVTYRCNLCRSPYSAGGEPAEKMLGIRFGEVFEGPKDQKTKRVTINWVAPVETENHLCRECFDALRRASIPEGQR